MSQNGRNRRISADDSGMRRRAEDFSPCHDVQGVSGSPLRAGDARRKWSHSAHCLSQTARRNLNGQTELPALAKRDARNHAEGNKQNKHRGSKKSCQASTPLSTGLTPARRAFAVCLLAPINVNSPWTTRSGVARLEYRTRKHR